MIHGIYKEFSAIERRNIMEIILSRENVMDIVLEHMRNLGYPITGNIITRCDRNSLIHVRVEVSDLRCVLPSQKLVFGIKER